KLLFLGDVVGRAGRDAVLTHLPALRKAWGLDFVVVNGDNVAGGFGITPTLCRDFFDAGADVVTGGDHIWDQKEIVPYLASEKRLLRPQNFPERTPGSGHGIYTTVNGKKVLVLHLLGQVFHTEHSNCPFATADTVLQAVRLGGGVQAIIVDFHAEATSEKMAMGQYLDGRVSLVVGSHTHVPTQDARLLPKKTAYQTDAGMCGDYQSVIGFKPEGPLERFLGKMKKIRLEPASGAGTVCGFYVETDDATGLATLCRPVQYPNPVGMAV
ncbi:MAG: YmdB family metallophosphoesterase, partial [Proteobacteria bacterium]|nr:YmdB family metallophosphoesterase [Pseudomonadota bacterium]